MSLKTTAFRLGTTLMVGGAPSAQAKLPEQQFSGEVKQLDSTAKNLIVKSHIGKMEEMTFSLPTATKIIQAGKAKTLSEIKNGERVRVTYTNEGTRHQAQRVDLLGASGAKSKPGNPAATTKATQ